MDENSLNDFVSENSEHLEQIDQDLLLLEKSCKNPDPELLNRIFRSTHTIKGASGFLGVAPLIEMSHVMENILMLIRDGTIMPDPGICDALLSGVDKLRIMNNDITASESVPYEDEVAQLNAILAGISPAPVVRTVAEQSHAGDSGVVRICCSKNVADMIQLKAAGPEGALPVIFEVDRNKIISEVGVTTQVYALWIFPDRDLMNKKRTFEEFMKNVRACGTCLGFDYDADQSDGACGNEEKGSVRHALFATILEPNMVSFTLDIPAEQVCMFDNAIINAAKQESGTVCNCNAISTTTDTGVPVDAEVSKTTAPSVRRGWRFHGHPPHQRAGSCHLPGHYDH